MKKFIFNLAAVLSLNFGIAQQINEQGFYTTEKGELFNGILFSHLGDVRFKITITQGLVTGEADYFYASGKLMEKGMFKEGKKDDKWIRYNENGSVEAVSFYSLGKKTGTWLVYDENGKKRFEMTYANGEKTGVWTNWDEHGVVVNTKNYNPQ